MATWTEAKGAGNDSYKAGKITEAVQHYTKALQFADVPEADRSTLLCNRAQAYLRLGENEKAIEDCTSCLTHQPTNVKALFRRAAGYEALKDHKQALADYRAVLAADAAVTEAKAGALRCEVSLGIVAAPKGKGKGREEEPVQLSEEDARTIGELQARVKEVRKQLMRAESQHRIAAEEKRKAELTLAQIGKLPEEHKVFTGVGRMYMQSPLPDVAKQLTDAAGKSETRLKVCVATLEHLKKQQAEADQAFLEQAASIRRKMGLP